MILYRLFNKLLVVCQEKNGGTKVNWFVGQNQLVGEDMISYFYVELI